jgi:hypothetical protein
MTKLELCKRLRQEASISGDGPASTLNQTGEMLRLVNWIEQAYEEIQNMRQDWLFRTKEFSFQTISGQKIYPKTYGGYTDIRDWKPNSFRVYTTATGIYDEQWLRYLDYNTHFRDYRDFGAASTQTGRPFDFSIKPDKSLVLFPIPDATGYTVKGQYYSTPHQMVTDIDEPIIPEQYQLIIVWKALQEYGFYESAQECIARGQKNFASYYRDLTFEQAPKPRIGRSLA